MVEFLWALLGAYTIGITLYHTYRVMRKAWVYLRRRSFIPLAAVFVLALFLVPNQVANAQEFSASVRSDQLNSGRYSNTLIGPELGISGNVFGVEVTGEAAVQERLDDNGIYSRGFVSITNTGKYWTQLNAESEPVFSETERVSQAYRFRFNSSVPISENYGVDIFLKNTQSGSFYANGAAALNGYRRFGTYKKFFDLGIQTFGTTHVEEREAIWTPVAYGHVGPLVRVGSWKDPLVGAITVFGGPFTQKGSSGYTASAQAFVRYVTESGAFIEGETFAGETITGVSSDGTVWEWTLKVGYKF